ncbi:MAG: type II toxin-antitoxin system YafQ family toxin [Fibrobacter sp.]|nr:type II toxin-antitoxin system YafQ family toxin [Fibrobacter sp.]
MMEIRTTSKFRKDLKLAKKKGLNIALLQEVVDVLASGEKLSEKHRDHALTGDWESFRECHIQPDWLLIYKISGDSLILTLVRTGTHSDLF